MNFSRLPSAYKYAKGWGLFEYIIQTRWELSRRSYKAKEVSLKDELGIDTDIYTVGGSKLYSMFEKAGLESIVDFLFYLETRKDYQSIKEKVETMYTKVLVPEDMERLEGYIAQLFFTYNKYLKGDVIQRQGKELELSVLGTGDFDETPKSGVYLEDRELVEELAMTSRLGVLDEAGLMDSEYVDFIDYFYTEYTPMFRALGKDLRVVVEAFLMGDEHISAYLKEIVRNNVEFGLDLSTLLKYRERGFE